MTTTCFIGVIVDVDGVAEAAVTDTAFTDASILLEISENITAMDMASITNLFMMIT
jgi:hypothetical protein